LGGGDPLGIVDTNATFNATNNINLRAAIFAGIKYLIFKTTDLVQILYD
jgi:hypothetical protein